MQCERVRPARLASALSLVVQVLNFGHPLFICRRGLSPQATSQHAMGGHERERESENPSFDSGIFLHTNMFLLRLALEVQSVANAVVSSIIMTRRVGVTKARQSSTLKQENQHLFPGRPALVGKGGGEGAVFKQKTEAVSRQLAEQRHL